MQIQQSPQGFSSKNSPLQQNPSGVLRLPFPFLNPVINSPSYFVPLLQVYLPFPSGNPCRNYPSQQSLLINFSLPHPYFLKSTKQPLYSCPPTMQIPQPSPLPIFHSPLQLSPNLFVQTPVPCLCPSFHSPIQYSPLSHSNSPSPERFQLKNCPLYTPDELIQTPLTLKLFLKTPQNTLPCYITTPIPSLELPIISPKKSSIREYQTKNLGLFINFYMAIYLLKGQYSWIKLASSY